MRAADQRCNMPQTMQKKLYSRAGLRRERPSRGLISCAAHQTLATAADSPDDPCHGALGSHWWVIRRAEFCRIYLQSALMI